jgi:hypothetical protein
MSLHQRKPILHLRQSFEGLNKWCRCPRDRNARECVADRTHARPHERLGITAANVRQRTADVPTLMLSHRLRAARLASVRVPAPDEVRNCHAPLPVSLSDSAHAERDAVSQSQGEQERRAP